MSQYLSKSLLLLLVLVIITSVLYPLSLWVVGQTLFPFQANGSLLVDASGKLIGSKLIAQPFTKDEYFKPRPSAASYNASASASSSLAASNYALRDRVARMLGPIVKYQNGRPVALDIEKWVQQDKFRGKPHLVATWAELHPMLAKAWVSSDATHSAYVDNWAKSHPQEIAQYVKAHPDQITPKAIDLAVIFFQSFSKENPGKFPVALTKLDMNGKVSTSIEAMNSGADIQSIFFDMWREDHPRVALQAVPADFVMTSASGLDPHITLQNAYFQLERVVHAWAQKLKKPVHLVHDEIEAMLAQNAEAPFKGLIGEKFINVLEVNLLLSKRYGKA